MRWRIPSRYRGSIAPAAMQRASSHRFRAGDKHLGGLHGTLRACGHSRLRIDGDGNDAVRRFERFGIGVAAQQERALHEFGPYGKRGMRALEVELAVIVEAHPYDAQKVGG